MMVTEAGGLMTEVYVQYGFAGFAGVLLTILVWMMRVDRADRQKSNDALVEVIQNNNKVLAKLHDSANAQIESERGLRETLKETRDEVSQLGKELMKRKCLVKE